MPRLLRLIVLPLLPSSRIAILLQHHSAFHFIGHHGAVPGCVAAHSSQAFWRHLSVTLRVATSYSSAEGSSYSSFAWTRYPVVADSNKYLDRSSPTCTRGSSFYFVVVVSTCTSTALHDPQVAATRRQPPSRHPTNLHDRHRRHAHTSHGLCARRAPGS
jgi:hypothetical protein